MQQKELIEEIQSKYSEWFEIAGDNSPALLINILTMLLVKANEENDYYKKMLKVYVR
jgi:hypothetical protein